MKVEKSFMICNFSYFRCAINLNDDFRITCRKTKMCILNITFSHKLLCRIARDSTKSLFLNKNLGRKKKPQEKRNLGF